MVKTKQMTQNKILVNKGQGVLKEESGQWIGYLTNIVGKIEY